jgi:hypothetical protein
MAAEANDAGLDASLAQLEQAFARLTLEQQNALRISQSGLGAAEAASTAGMTPETFQRVVNEATDELRRAVRVASWTDPEVRLAHAEAALARLLREVKKHDFSLWRRFNMLSIGEHDELFARATKSRSAYLRWVRAHYAKKALPELPTQYPDLDADMRVDVYELLTLTWANRLKPQERRRLIGRGKRMPLSLWEKVFTGKTPAERRDIGAAKVRPMLEAVLRHQRRLAREKGVEGPLRERFKLLRDILERLRHIEYFDGSKGSPSEVLLQLVDLNSRQNLSRARRRRVHYRRKYVQDQINLFTRIATAAPTPDVLTAAQEALQQARRNLQAGRLGTETIERFVDALPS